MRTKLLALLLPFAAAAALAQTAVPPRVCIINNHENALAIVDPEKREVVATVAVGNGPHEVVTSEDGRLAIVSNYGTQVAGNTLSIVDVATAKELRRVSVAPLARPHGLVVSGHRVYFTAEASLAIGRLDLDDDTVDMVVGTSQKISHMIAMDRANKRLFTANMVSGTISQLEPAQGPGGWTVTQIPVANGPEAIDVSPDGKQVWTGHRPTGGISVIDTATSKVVANVPVETFVFRIRFTPDGRYALATEPEAGAVLVFDAATRQLAKKIPIDGAPVGITLDRAGKRAYVAAADKNKVVVIDLTTLTVAGDMPSGGSPDGIAVTM